MRPGQNIGKLLGLACVIVLLGVVKVQAAYTWQTSTGDWATLTNWNPLPTVAPGTGALVGAEVVFANSSTSPWTISYSGGSSIIQLGSITAIADSKTGGITFSLGSSIIRIQDGGSINTLGAGPITFSNWVMGMGALTVTAEESNKLYFNNTVSLLGDSTFNASNSGMITFNSVVQIMGDYTLSLTADSTSSIVAANTIAGTEDLGSVTINGVGAVTYSGSSANTYLGTTTVNGGGILYLSKSAGVTSIAGDLEISNNSKVQMTTNEQIANTSNVLINGGSLVVADVTETIGDGIKSLGGLTVNGKTSSVSVMSSGGSGATLTVDATLTFSDGGSATVTGPGAVLEVKSVAYTDTGAGTASAITMEDTGTLNLIAGTGTAAVDGLGIMVNFNIANSAADTELTINGAITGDSGIGLQKSGAGVMMLTGDGNTYTGNTSITGGTLMLKGAGSTMLGTGAIVKISTGGTLLLGASDQIYDSQNMILNGGTFNTAGMSETLGSLTLTADSTLDMGGMGTVVFSECSGTWTGNLTVTNWLDTKSVLVFATWDNSYLSQIHFDGYASVATRVVAEGTEVYGVVPEPGTVVGGIMILLALAWMERKRIKEIYAKLGCVLG